MVDGAMLGGSHQPSAWIVRDARLRPLLKGGDERVLREFFGNAHIADDARKSGDNSGGLDPPDCVDCAMCIGSRHDYR
jgi:hypothetical protein